MSDAKYPHLEALSRYNKDSIKKKEEHPEEERYNEGRIFKGEAIRDPYWLGDRMERRQYVAINADLFDKLLGQVVTGKAKLEPNVDSLCGRGLATLASLRNDTIRHVFKVPAERRKPQVITCPPRKTPDGLGWEEPMTVIIKRDGDLEEGEEAAWHKKCLRWYNRAFMKMDNAHKTFEDAINELRVTRDEAALDQLLQAYTKLNIAVWSEVQELHGLARDEKTVLHSLQETDGDLTQINWVTLEITSDANLPDAG